MVPVTFPQCNTTWAKNQSMNKNDPDGPKFTPLEAYSDNDQTISKWKLTWRERIEIFLFGTLWHRQLNWGQPLQGIWMQVEPPTFLENTEDMIKAEL